MSCVAIIPARGGSKGIPGKNLIDFCGKPLIAWSIIQACQADAVDEVFVSSDCDQILRISGQYGAKPIRRPAQLATDRATSESALEHALDTIMEDKGSDPSLVVFLQATSPLRDHMDIDHAVAVLLEGTADSLFSSAVLDDFCVWAQDGENLKGLTFDPFNRGRRQDRDPVFLENGSIYVFRSAVFRSTGNRMGGRIVRYDMPFWKSHEIDSPDDVGMCEYYFRQRLITQWDKSDEDTTLAKDSIDLVVYDFDGVMTDNRVMVLQDGKEAVIANRADGLGVTRIRELGIPQLILSTESNSVVAARAAKLNLDVVQGCDNKKKALISYCEKHDYRRDRVVYVGNDVNDIDAMKVVKYPVAPADAHPDVTKIAVMVTVASGGGGVVKELSERILDLIRVGKDGES